MRTLEMSAKTPEEAIELALRELDAEREEVEIAVVSRGKAGILGIGSEPARVRVTVLDKPTDVVRATSGILASLLSKMGVSAVAVVQRAQVDEMGGPVFTVEGEDSGLLIGRRGETLRALQLVVNLLARRQLETMTSIIVDVAGYQERRTLALTTLADRVAQRVAETGRPIVLEPMPSHERRVVHLVLAGDDRVTTESMGVGEGRQVVVSPRTPAVDTEQPSMEEQPPTAQDDPAGTL